MGKRETYALRLFWAQLSVHINYVLIMKRSILSYGVWSLYLYSQSVMPHYATFYGKGGKHYTVFTHYIN